MPETRPYYYVYDNSETISYVLYEQYYNDVELAQEKLMHPTYFYELTSRPRPVYVPPPKHIIPGHGGRHPSERDVIESVASIPHAWGGGYDPTLQTIHGPAIFDFIEELPEEFSATKDYILTNKVSYNDRAYIAIADVVAASVVTPDMLPLVWKDLSTRVATDKDVCLLKEGLKRAVYVQSSALIPDETVAQFTAIFDSDSSFSVAVGLAVEKPNLAKGLTNFDKGVVLVISNSKSHGLAFTVKKANGTADDFDAVTTWKKFNGATSTLSELDCLYTDLAKGDHHTFQIESSKGRIRVKVDHVKFGEWTYPDATYPLRKHVTGDTVGHIEDHYEEDYYVLQSLSGTKFEITDLGFNRLSLAQISDNFATDIDAKIVEASVKNGSLFNIYEGVRFGADHGRTSRPRVFGANVVCKIATGGYNVGDAISMKTLTRSSNVYAMWASDDFIFIEFKRTNFYFINKGVNVNSSIFDPLKWQLELWWI